MNIPTYKYLIALLVIASTSTTAWADRILISDNQQTVTLSHALDCYSAPNIRIDTSQPEMYTPESTRLQAVSDTVRAMLSYECPGLSQINITGTIRGLEGIVYRGELRARNHWLVQSPGLTSSSHGLGYQG